MYARTIITNWFPGLVCKFSGKASGLSDHSSAGLTSFPRRWLKKERLVFRWHTSRWSHPMDIQPTCLPIPDKTQWSDDLPPFYFCYWALGEHLYQQGTDRRDVYHRWKTTQPNHGLPRVHPTTPQKSMVTLTKRGICAQIFTQKTRRTQMRASHLAAVAVFAYPVLWSSKKSEQKQRLTSATKVRALGLTSTREVKYRAKTSQ